MRAEFTEQDTQKLSVLSTASQTLGSLDKQLNVNGFSSWSSNLVAELNEYFWNKSRNCRTDSTQGDNKEEKLRFRLIYR